MKLRIGSRESRLAVAQAELIMKAIQAAHPEINLELVTMKTTGDKILDRTLDKIGGKGLFVRELDAALRAGRVDLTVHSCKDLPMEIPKDLPLTAFTQREDPRDALVLPVGVTEWNQSRPVGSASLRRSLQLQALYPGLEVRPVRGNVLTRLEKLERGEYGALVLAVAGLRRLGLEKRVSRIFTPEELLPAAGQGILAVQCRIEFDTAFLDCLRDKNAEVCALAERAFAGRLNGGCSSPAAAYAVTENGQITITGMYVNETNQIWKGTVSGPISENIALACGLADRLKEDAAWREK